MIISYAVFSNTLGSGGASGVGLAGRSQALINPSDGFIDLLSPLLNMSRGRKIGFFIQGDYGVDPSEALADSLVPSLNGGDYILYHALKSYNLAPELHWTAGGYIWHVDQTVDMSGDPGPLSSPSRLAGFPPLRGAFAAGQGDVDLDSLRAKVEASGAVLLATAGISILGLDWSLDQIVGKERVTFVSSRGELEKLVVNAVVVVYVP